MRFGPVPVDEAAGAILAHGLRLEGGAFAKGRVLEPGDVERLREAGVESVTVARLEPGDVHEDPAAELLADAAAGEGVRHAAPFTGRCNLFAERGGLLIVDRERLDAANTVDEAITIATLAPYTVVTARALVATVKIIPFAVSGDRLAAARRALEQAGTGAVVRVAPFRGLAAGLVQTRLPGTREAVLDKTRRVSEARLARLGMELVGEWRAAHDTGAVAGAIGAALDARAELVLVAGASATVDRRDVVPAAIEAAGGRIDHFGMPVDPGNLLLLAHHGEVPVLGLPGCARSPRYNGFDQVLERLAAGVAVSSRDLMTLGAGGLLKDTVERGLPRRGGAGTDEPARAPRVAAIVLAAGQSRRMGGVNKLLEPVDGSPMVRRVVETALASSARPVLVVTGHERERVEAALAGCDVRLVHNPDYAAGLSASLACAVAALGPEVEAAVVCLGDMPRVRPEHLERLVAAFDPVEGREICVATHRGKRGNPVLWSRRYFPEILDVRGDVGARHLIGEHAESVCEVAMDDDGVLVDVDSVAALERLRAGP